MNNILDGNTLFYLVIFWLIILWSVPWKAYALWKAARNNSKWWYIALLVVNTFGILEIFYIFYFAKKKKFEAPAESLHEPLKHEASSMIKFSDFEKVHLKIAQIREAERVEGSDKLVKLKVTVGDEERQIVAGIGKAYTPSDLISKEIVIVTNLEPRKLMGLESQGMLLAASDGQMPVLLMPDKEVKPGSSIH